MAMGGSVFKTTSALVQLSVNKTSQSLNQRRFVAIALDFRLCVTKFGKSNSGKAVRIRVRVDQGGQWIFKKLVSFDTHVCLRFCGERERKSDHRVTEDFQNR